MGAGKTTIGRALAERGGLVFEDVDAIVERNEGRTIEEIFRTDGEGAFRAAEESALLGLGAARGRVVATGGGLFLGAAQRRHMKSSGVVLWLDVSCAVALERVGDDATRPLWLPDEPVRFRAWFERRRAAYALAHARVDADAPVDEVTRRAVRALAHLGHPAGFPSDAV
jgi:shikimate kinase